MFSKIIYYFAAVKPARKSAANLVVHNGYLIPKPPSKAPSALNLFVKQDTKHKLLAQKVAAWKALPEEQKKVFMEKSKQLAQEKVKLKEAYQKQYIDPIKRPAGPFALFFKQYREENKDKFTKASPTAPIKEASQKWKSLSVDQKKKYEPAAKQDPKEFQKFKIPQTPKSVSLEARKEYKNNIKLFCDKHNITTNQLQKLLKQSNSRLIPLSKKISTKRIIPRSMVVGKRAATRKSASKGTTTRKRAATKKTTTTGAKASQEKK